MTDRDLVLKKLAVVDTSVQELRARARPDALAIDDAPIAIQAVLDVASHIVSDERLGEPRTNRELLDLLERNGWLPSDVASVVRRMVGLRNVLVHGYDIVGVAVVRDVVERRLDDLLRVVTLIRSRLR